MARKYGWDGTVDVDVDVPEQDERLDPMPKFLPGEQVRHINDAGPSGLVGVIKRQTGKSDGYGSPYWDVDWGAAYGHIDYPESHLVPI
jgi:hypothetical protein